MSLASTFASPPLLLALAFLLCAGLAEPVLEHRVARALAGNHAFHWSWEHVLAPALRAAIIAGFVLLSYPALFGVRAAPSLHELLVAGSGRLDTLLGTLFVLSLLLPLSRVVASRSALLLPLQGLIATAFVFAWYADFLGVTSASLWPGAVPAAAICVLVVIGHRAAVALAGHAARTLDRLAGTHGLEPLLRNCAELLIQAPVAVLYGYALGRQLAI